MKKRLISILLVIVICVGVCPLTALAARDTSYEEALALELKALGLFEGVSDTEFDLGRAPTRTEALAMLVRVLGKKSEALNGTWQHPFDDVQPWAEKYVGYAYQNGLTDGVSDTKFGAGAASAAMYVTFVLRALGYTDGEGKDFIWSDPFALARSIGILPDGVDLNNFWRADVVLVSHAALDVKLKGSTRTLGEKLISAGMFTKATFDSVYGKAVRPERAKLTSQEIYAKCSPAVFCIRTYDASGAAYALGSGFFISADGIAVTNHHVLENALTATATTTDGAVHEILGVIYYNEYYDYAVIKVQGSGFTTLAIGDSDVVTGGETIYTIGNPEGLTNTISSGMISNPRRSDYRGMIQISAPISSGSSGGALINEYGEAIGVTTGSLVSGQNLNFAIPIYDVLKKGDAISGFEQKYGMYTMAEYAQENGYVGKRHDVFEALKAFVVQNANETYGGYPAYEEIDDSNNVVNTVIYDKDSNVVTLCCGYGSDSAYFVNFVDITGGSDIIDISFTYYANVQDDEPMFEGVTSYYAEDLSENMNFAFDRYSGPDELLPNCSDMALAMSLVSVDFLNYILDYIGGYTVADLGLTGF